MVKLVFRTKPLALVWGIQTASRAAIPFYNSGLKIKPKTRSDCKATKILRNWKDFCYVELLETLVSKLVFMCLLLFLQVFYWFSWTVSNSYSGWDSETFILSVPFMIFMSCLSVPLHQSVFSFSRLKGPSLLILTLWKLPCFSSLLCPSPNHLEVVKWVIRFFDRSCSCLDLIKHSACKFCMYTF